MHDISNHVQAEMDKSLLNGLMSSGPGRLSVPLLASRMWWWRLFAGQRDCFDKNMLLLRDTKTHKSEKGWDHPPPNNFWYKYYNTCQKALSLKLYTCSTIIKGKYKLSDYCPVTCKSCGKREIVKKGGAYEYQYDYEYVLPDNFDPAKRTMADVCSVKCKQCEGA